ncbi:MAG: hypothetical protein BWY82_02289 [Verrucomicrobia bacterium ADurb.Bin474]|nr:MAG: hypothetical protein BWY82_02289 [Verrucomicrobia bacterium ADurb.Bin474]
MIFRRFQKTDTAIHAFDKRPTDSQAETGSLLVLSVNPLERLKDAFLLVHRDPGSGVRHDDFEGSVRINSYG